MQTTTTNLIEMLKNDVATMRANGVCRMWSSVEMNIADAESAASDVVARASVKRAAQYLYGILDSRFSMFA